MISFKDLGLDSAILQTIEESGYQSPTPIQKEAIPEALKGKDVLGIAQTGTGKTASFTLPIISLLSKGRARARMARSLVLCPTRELAAQVATNFDNYAKKTKLSKALLIGGVSFIDQSKIIDRGVDVLIATPGRLLDHFNRGKLMLNGVQIMVVDEADRMLDMGFIPDIERIFKLTPFTRQTLFFSATMPPEIERLTKEFLQAPIYIEVSKQSTTSKNIKQTVTIYKPLSKKTIVKEKRHVLRTLLELDKNNLTNGIIFCNKKVEVDILTKSLQKHGYNANAIHGDLKQKERMEILELFKNGQTKLLVASDVAARGLDIPLVSHVFNFDIPMQPEDYIHRIGRTGRAGREGKAYTICLTSELDILKKIEVLTGNKIKRQITKKLKESLNLNNKVKKANTKNEKSRLDEQNTEVIAGTTSIIGMGDHIPAFMIKKL